MECLWHIKTENISTMKMDLDYYKVHMKHAAEICKK